jgi:uncharacterized protein YaiI (UPF0178 family)
LEVGNLKDTLHGAYNFVVPEEINLNGRIVQRDTSLMRDLSHLFSQINLRSTLDERNQENQSWTTLSRKASQPENNQPFILLYDPNSSRQDRKSKYAKASNYACHYIEIH